MTKKERQFEKWALGELEQISKVLLTDDFFPIKLKKGCSANAYASIDMAYPYKSITINWSDDLYKWWSEKKYTEVRQILVHEMCHPLTDPLYSKGVDRYMTKDALNEERERLTDHIANIVLKNNLI